MGQNSSKKKELVTLLDQVAGDPRLSEKMQLILDVKNAESFKDFLPKSKNATAEKDIALALIYQATVAQLRNSFNILLIHTSSGENFRHLFVWVIPAGSDLYVFSKFCPFYFLRLQK